jgi:hypothetical protein
VIEWARPAVGADPGGHRAEFVRLVEKARAVAESHSATSRRYSASASDEPHGPV